MSYSYKEICNFKVGEKYWESSQYGNVHFEVLTKPVVKDGKVSFWAYNREADKSFRILMTEGLEHYGPKIYDRPVYMTMEMLQNIGGM